MAKKWFQVRKLFDDIVRIFDTGLFADKHGTFFQLDNDLETVSQVDKRRTDTLGPIENLPQTLSLHPLSFVPPAIDATIIVEYITRDMFRAI
jgi:hypothetical protein